MATGEGRDHAMILSFFPSLFLPFSLRGSHVPVRVWIQTICICNNVCRYCMLCVRVASCK